MDAILLAATSRAPLYHQGVADGVAQPETSYRYMLAVDVYDALLSAFGTAMTRCLSTSGAAQLTAGGLYRQVYHALTNRAPRSRDCATLDRLEARLLDP